MNSALVSSVRGAVLAGLLAAGACRSKTPAEPASACLGPPEFERASAWKFRAHIPPTVYRYDLAISEVQALRVSLGPGAPAHVRGLTRGEFSLKKNYRLEARRSGPKILCLWLEDLELDLSYSMLEVTIANDFPEGSCAYNALLSHEREHEDVHRSLHAAAAAELRGVLEGNRALPFKGNPLPAPSLEAGKALIARLLDQAVDPAFARMKAEMDVRQKNLDSADSYLTLGVSCPDWK